MKLAKIDTKLPVKAYPETELNRVILMEFTPWLCGLLSLTGETSVDRLEFALPAIKENCWSMGFDEIKKMFEMYADNKLSIQPIPNYFDRILFGKIVAAYKQQKPVKKKELVIPEVSEAEKILQINRGILRCYDEFKEEGEIPNGYVWVYDHLEEIGVISFSKEEKQKAMPKARAYEKSVVDMSKAGAKNILEMIENKKSSRVINKAKRMLLEKYFSTTEKESLRKLLNTNGRL